MVIYSNLLYNKNIIIARSLEAIFLKKLNQKGFVLIETLVVAVFIMTIFSLLFTNFYPLFGEYEKRETYDDVEGKYVAYWTKQFLLKHQNLDSVKNEIQSVGYYEFKCSDILEPELAVCKNTLETLPGGKVQMGVTQVIVTKYELMDFKSKVENGSISLNRGFKEYIASLPNYNKVHSTVGAEYRILVEMKRYLSNDNHNQTEADAYPAYATMEVKI